MRVRAQAIVVGVCLQFLPGCEVLIGFRDVKSRASGDATGLFDAPIIDAGVDGPLGEDRKSVV